MTFLEKRNKSGLFFIKRKSTQREDKNAGEKIAFMLYFFIFEFIMKYLAELIQQFIH